MPELQLLLFLIVVMVDTERLFLVDVGRPDAARRVRIPQDTDIC